MVGNALLHLIAQSDSITLTVLAILGLFSVIGWSITLYKAILFFIQKRSIKKVLSALSFITKEKELILLAQKYPNSSIDSIITDTITHQNTVHTVSYSTLQLQQEQSIDQIVSRSESLISFLSMSAAVAPLLGLFGTVWGLVHSFMSIGMQQSADIATVAPGIAQALVTTLVGLCVAIPAVACASYLHTQVRSIEQLLYACAQKIIFISVKQVEIKEGACASVVLNADKYQSPMSR